MQHDMIDNTLAHFSELINFLTELNAGNVPDTCIVFIKDIQLIWTHGTYYPCPKTLEELEAMLADILSQAKTYTDEKVAELIDSAPETMDTLNELATAILENESILDTFATKADVESGLNGKVALNGTVTAIIAMTLAEYDALGTKDATTLYIITD